MKNKNKKKIQKAQRKFLRSWRRKKLKSKSFWGFFFPPVCVCVELCVVPCGFEKKTKPTVIFINRPKSLGGGGGKEKFVKWFTA